MGEDMKRVKLYIDFDGVILDTINQTYKLFREQYGFDPFLDYDPKNDELITKFYKNLDWYNLLITTKELNNAFMNIKKIIASDLFDVEILTHVNSKQEGEDKILFTKDKLPDINVVVVPKTTAKCNFVNPENAVLIDDFVDNLVLWHESGGIPVKYSDSNKPSKYLSITSLEQIIDKYVQIKEMIANSKTKVKGNI